MSSRIGRIFKLILTVFFTFFYTNRRKYWFRQNFRLSVFNGFTCLGCPDHDLTISGKCQSVCLLPVCVSVYM